MARMRFLSIFLAGLALFLLATPAQSQNLVINGSFEDPPIPGVFLITTIPGWTVTGGGVGEIHRGISGITGAMGKQWLELDANSNTSIYQDIPTVPDQRYRLLFRDANRPGDSGSRIDILWNDVLQGWTTPTSSEFRAINGGEFVATGRVSRIGFRAAGPSNSIGDLLDDVIVYPIDAAGSFSGFNYYFPQVADGGGWLTSAYITGELGFALDYTATEYADDGHVLFTWQGSVGSNQTGTISTAGTGAAIQSGWVQIKTTQPARIVAIYRERTIGRPDFEASVPSREATQRMAGVFDNRNGFATGIALSNPGTASIRLNIILRNSLGNTLGTRSLTLSPKGHAAFFLSPAWPETANLLGRIEIEAVDAATGADALFVPIGLRFSPGGAFTTIPY